MGQLLSIVSLSIMTKNSQSRKSIGQGVLALSALVGLIIIPLIGIFSFEIARYQHGVNQLNANCDSAALAGSAMLVTSKFQSKQDRLKRFAEATKAAENAFKSTFTQTNAQLNDVLGSTLRAAVDVGKDGTLTLGTQPGDCTYKIQTVDPSNLSVVEPTDDKAKAIKVSAQFTARPAFSKFLGLGSLVPIVSRAVAGIPVLDVVVCFDVSGSMDDSTRVSFVNRRFTIPKPASVQIGAAYLDYTNALAALRNYIGSSSYDPNICAGYFNTASQKWNAYKTLRLTLADQKGKVEYGQVQVGTLADCVFNPIAADGIAINTRYPQNLNLVNWEKQFSNSNQALPTFNYAERAYQESGGPNPGAEVGNFACGGNLGPGYPSNYGCACPTAPQGFTDLIVKVDHLINTNPVQPLFGLQGPKGLIPPNGIDKFTYVKKREPFKGQSYTFDGVAYLVEAERGNLEVSRFNQLKNNLFKNNIADGELPNQGKDGYQSAYFEMAGAYSQPISCTIDALQNFYQALNGAGADVHFGLVAFESLAAQGTPSLTDVALQDIAFNQPVVCPVDINTSSPNYPTPPTGPKRYPILRMPLSLLKDPVNDLVPDPTDSNKPNLTMNDIFENYLLPLRATNIPKALAEALDILGNSPRKVYSRQCVILITDGIATRTLNGDANNALAQQQSRDQATRANNAGVPIYTIGVGQNEVVEQIQVPFLGDEFSNSPQGIAKLSGNGARFFAVNKNSIVAPGGGQVNAISQAFLQVARSLVQLID
ncbi:hypothetical protein BH10CYA1_BH10CYA1_24510 [soil metagenome]